MIVVEKTKDLIVKLIRTTDGDNRMNISDYLEQHLPYSYTYLSRIFTEYTHMGIEKFFILKKIEFVKELLTTSNLTLTEISYKSGYKSVAHLSKQFKRLSGLSDYTGTGIGLAICKRIMDIHNGYIDVNSKKGEGATFIVYFPIVSKS